MFPLVNFMALPSRPGVTTRVASEMLDMALPFIKQVVSPAILENDHMAVLMIL